MTHQSQTFNRDNEEYIQSFISDNFQTLIIIKVETKIHGVAEVILRCSQGAFNRIKNDLYDHLQKYGPTGMKWKICRDPIYDLKLDPKSTDRRTSDQVTIFQRPNAPWRLGD